MIVLPSSNSGLAASKYLPGYKTSNSSTITRTSYGTSINGKKFYNFLYVGNNPDNRMLLKIYVTYISFNGKVLLNTPKLILDTYYSNTSQIILRNDGYGLGVVNLIDPLNNFLKNYISPSNLTFYPNGGNGWTHNIAVKYKSDQQIIIKLYDDVIWYWDDGIPRNMSQILWINYLVGQEQVGNVYDFHDQFTTDMPIDSIVYSVPWI